MAAHTAPTMSVRIRRKENRLASRVSCSFGSKIPKVALEFEVSKQQRCHTKVEQECDHVGESYYEHRRSERRVNSESFQENRNKRAERARNNQAQDHSHAENPAQFQSKPHRAELGAEPKRDDDAHGDPYDRPVDQTDERFF